MSLWENLLLDRAIGGRLFLHKSAFTVHCGCSHEEIVGVGRTDGLRHLGLGLRADGDDDGHGAFTGRGGFCLGRRRWFGLAEARRRRQERMGSAGAERNWESPK